MSGTAWEETRAELWVNAPGETEYEPLVAHLDRLEAAGDIDEYVVYHWGHDLDVSSDRLQCIEDQLARERIAAFKQWATEHGCTVLGLGDRVTTGVGRMGPEITVEHLPPVLLAEYVGDELDRVTPCSAGDEHVSERLAALATAEVERETTAEEAATASVESQPDQSGEPVTPAEGSRRSLRSRLRRWRR